MKILIDFGIKFILYSLSVFGLWLFINKFLIGFFKGSSRYVKPESNTKPLEDNKFISHLRLLLFVTLGKNKDKHVYLFIFISLFLFLFSILIFVSLFGTSKFFLLIATFIFIGPYLILRVRLSGIQIDSSYEGVSFISELTNMYKINNLNMVSAIDKTIFSLKDCPHSKKALFNLSLSIKDYRSEKDLNYAIDGFVATTGTEWAKLLGINIMESIINGTDISLSLDSVLSELKEIKILIEKDRRANNEAFNMVKFVIPGVYILSFLAANKLFGFSFKKFFDYQFGTPLGVRLFVVIMVFTIISFIAMFILRRPKFDY